MRKSRNSLATVLIAGLIIASVFSLSSCAVEDIKSNDAARDCSNQDVQLRIYEELFPGWRNVPIDIAEQWLSTQGEKEKKLYYSNCARDVAEITIKFVDYIFKRMEHLKIEAKESFIEGNYDQAEILYGELVYHARWTLGDSHVETLDYLSALSRVYERQQKHQDEIDTRIQSLVISNSIHGIGSDVSAQISSKIGSAYYKIGDFQKSENYLLDAYRPDKIQDYDAYLFSYVGLLLAKTYRAQSKHNESEVIYNKIIDHYKGATNTDHQYYHDAVNGLILLYVDLDRLNEAEELSKHIFQLKEDQGDSEGALITLSNVALILSKQGKLFESIKINRLILDSEEKMSGKNSPETLTTRSNLAVGYNAIGWYNKAADELLNILSIEENLYGKGNINTANTLSNLGVAYSDLGNINLAIEYSEKALRTKREYYPKDHNSIGVSVNNLASAYVLAGRLQEAINMLEEQLSIYEITYGDFSSHVSTVLSNIGYIYSNQRKYDNAVKLYERALLIDQKLYGNDSQKLVSIYSDLGFAYQNLFDYNKALENYTKGLEISNKRRDGEITPDQLVLIGNFSLLHEKFGDHDDALQNFLYINRMEKAFYGDRYAGSITTLHNIAYTYLALEQYEKALKYQNQSIDLLKSIFGNNDQSRYIESLSLLSKIYKRDERYQEALEISNEMYRVFYNSIVGEHANIISPTPDNYNDTFFRRHIDLLLDENTPISKQKKLESSFEAVQFTLSSASSIGKTISKIGIRFSSGEDNISELLRRQQDIVLALRELSASMVNLLGQPVKSRDKEYENLLRHNIENNKVALSEITNLIAQKYPRYAELSSIKPISMHDAQGLLSDEEAMIVFSYSDNSEKTHVWSLTNNTASVSTLNISYIDLETKIMQLREGIELDSNGRTHNFDTSLSHALYDLLLSPVVDKFDGIKHLIIVPEGPLLGLSFNLLVANEPESSSLGGGKSAKVTRGISGVVQKTTQHTSTLDPDSVYRDTQWLIDKFSLSTIPTIRSLGSLRSNIKPSSASQPFIGFGDPLLSDSQQASNGIEKVSLFSRGAIADVNEIRNLPSLPDTAKEIEMMASSLGADSESIILRDRATEHSVKNMNLMDKKVIAFATHGLLSRELENHDEPGLVLTPPEFGTIEDDGVLTASEIAELKLDSDWIILSACNTAAGNEPNAERLSGLANSFFYAGTRAILVSHWPVISSSTTTLTTTIFDTINREPTLQKSEALRRSMVSMKNSDDYSHPIYWAPFSLIGLDQTALQTVTH